MRSQIGVRRGLKLPASRIVNQRHWSFGSLSMGYLRPLSRQRVVGLSVVVLITAPANVQPLRPKFVAAARRLWNFPVEPVRDHCGAVR